MKKTLLVALAALFPALVSGPTAAQEVTLRLVSAFPENQFYVKRTVEWIEKVNKDGKGVLQINFIGGPKAIPTFEVGKAGQTGVVAIGFSTRAFSPHTLPQADIPTLSPPPTAAPRRKGADPPLPPHPAHTAYPPPP